MEFNDARMEFNDGTSNAAYILVNMCKLYFTVAWPSMDPQKTHGSQYHTYVKGDVKQREHKEYQEFCNGLLARIDLNGTRVTENQKVCDYYNDPNRRPKLAEFHPRARVSFDRPWNVGAC
ncbi:hypothetical protein EJ08DRAFT_653081 [Tothia fuscella]|uniref:Uncharacterized protein n=1 Tax=Tothia fuscella TaxID=1048955 RepID=A0A9P4NIL7_9PEZI|nr:hypothetical protein EJ08DRAFT_653081 [Tothia fuscella]